MESNEASPAKNSQEAMNSNLKEPTIRFPLILGGMVLIALSAVLIFLPLTLFFKDYVAGVVGGAGVILIFTEAIEVEGRKDAHRKHQKVLNELKKVNNELKKVNNELKSENLELHKSIESYSEPIRKKWAAALCVGFGFFFDSRTKSQWLWAANDLGVADLYSEEPNESSKEEIERHLQRESLETSLAFQLGVDLQVLSWFGYREPMPTAMKILGDTLKSFKVEREVVAGVEKYWEVWYSRRGKPLGSKMYFLLLWVYLTDCDFGHIPLLQSYVGDLSDFLLNASEWITRPDFENNCKKLVERAPSHFEGKLIETQTG